MAISLQLMRQAYALVNNSTHECMTVKGLEHNGAQHDRFQLDSGVVVVFSMYNERIEMRTYDAKGNTPAMHIASR